MPGIRPESSGPVCAVTACRTSTSRVGGFGSVSALVAVVGSVAAGSHRSSLPASSDAQIPAAHPVRIPRA